MPPIAVLRAINKKPSIGASVKSVKETERSINQLANKVVAEMKKYPPRTPDQKYRRTGNLSRGWRTVRGYSTGDHYQVKIVNDVRGQKGPYAAEVQGVRNGAIGSRQSLYFASRGWSSIEDVLNEEFYKTLPEIRKSFRRRAP